MYVLSVCVCVCSVYVCVEGGDGSIDLGLREREGFPDWRRKRSQPSIG
jgi:hypothetical protein